MSDGGGARPVARAVGATRHVVLIAVVGLGLLSITTFVWAIAKSVKLVDILLDGGWRRSPSLVALLQAVDVYLLAVVLLVVSLGLYELFVGNLDLPPWLVVHSFDELKKSVIDVLVVFVAVRGVEDLFTIPDAADRLMSVGAVALLIGALTFFKWRPSTKPKPPPTGA